MKKILLFAITIFALISCGDDLDTGGTIYYDRPGSGVFVCNEGNFGSSNSSLSFYDISSGEVDDEIYFNANNIPLGDVCSSMSIIDGTGFVVVNNSGKIALIDPVTFRYKGVIKGLTAPRYIEPAGDGKLYITDLYSSQVTVVDRASLEITGTIKLEWNGLSSNTSEGVTQDGRYVYITAWSYDDRVFRIDTSTDKVDGMLTVTKQPNSIVTDKNGYLWVLSDGGYEGSPAGQEIAALTRIDPATFTVDKVFVFPDMASSPQKLSINGTGDRLYFLNSSWTASVIGGGVYVMGIDDGALPAMPLIPEDGKLFYGLGIDPSNSDIYVSDAVDYQQKGMVYRYSSSGAIVDSFKAGIIPAAFCFKQAQ